MYLLFFLQTDQRFGGQHKVLVAILCFSHTKIIAPFLIFIQNPRLQTES